MWGLGKIGHSLARSEINERVRLEGRKRSMSGSGYGGIRWWALVFIARRRWQRGFSRLPRVFIARGTRVGRVVQIGSRLIAGRTEVIRLLWDQGFESRFLQRGVYCEPHFGAHSIGEPKVGIHPARSYCARERGGGTWMEMVVPIARKRMHRSRAVDHEGEILDISAQYHSLIADSLYEEA